MSQPQLSPDTIAFRKIIDQLIEITEVEIAKGMKEIKRNPGHFANVAHWARVIIENELELEQLKRLREREM